MQIHVSVEIDRPIEEVFQYTTQHVPEWNSTVVEHQIIEDVSRGDVGTLFRSVMVDKGRRLDFRGTVIDHDPPRHTLLHLSGQYFDMVIDYRFEDLRDRTRVTQDTEVLGKGFNKFVLAAIGWLLQDSAARPIQLELDHLKRRLESRNPSTLE
jgi:hypothetical protein